LALGRGFTEPYLWNYLAPVTTLPAPSHLYWMPLPSLVAAPFIAFAHLFTPAPLNADLTFHAAQIPFVMAAAALPALSYGVAWRATASRRHAWGAAWLTLFSGYYFLYWVTTDSFALFALVTAGALWLTVQAQQHNSGRFGFWAGVCVGLSHSARADGILVGGVIALWALSAAARRASRAQARWLLAAALGYGLVFGPWLMRNWLVIGSPLAPGGARAMWLLDYNDLFLYPADLLTPDRFVAAGAGVIGHNLWQAAQTNFGTLVAAQGAVMAFPFVLAGFWQLRRQALFQLAGAYTLALFAVMTFLFPFPGMRGGLLHSGAALLPFFFTAALVGLDAAVEAAGRWLTHWQPARSKPIFAALLIGLITLLALSLFYGRYVNPNRLVNHLYQEVGVWLTQAGDETSIVLSNTPPAFYYHTGHPSLIIPNGDAETLAHVMRVFGARWVLLDAGHPAGLATLYAAPTRDPRFALRATFGERNEMPAYVLEFTGP
jgi:hypothetical protein